MTNEADENKSNDLPEVPAIGWILLVFDKRTRTLLPSIVNISANEGMAILTRMSQETELTLLKLQKAEVMDASRRKPC